MPGAGARRRRSPRAKPVHYDSALCKDSGNLLQAGRVDRAGLRNGYSIRMAEGCPVTEPEFGELNVPSAAMPKADNEPSPRTTTQFCAPEPLPKFCVMAPESS